MKCIAPGCTNDAVWGYMHCGLKDCTSPPEATVTMSEDATPELKEALGKMAKLAEERAPERMQQIETLLEEEVSARTAYEEDGVSGYAHYLGLIMELAPPELHARLAAGVEQAEPVAWLLQSRTPTDHDAQEPDEWETEDFSYTKMWRDNWLADKRPSEELRAVPLYTSPPASESPLREALEEIAADPPSEKIRRRVFRVGHTYKVYQAIAREALAQEQNE